MTSNPYAVPSTFTVQLKPCGCGVLLGEECDCAAFAEQAARLFSHALVLHTGPGPATAPGPSTAFPTPTVFALIGGRLRPVEDPS